ncbi:haloacid dehalogenase-like hydrolase [Gracilaria domingensis]|nr:haloacid dehalogenase-like hydrolase [Gracilaria domingensis]
MLLFLPPLFQRLVTPSTRFNRTSPSASNLYASLQSSRPSIRVIASDIDGTLLTSKKRLHPKNEPFVKRAVESGVLFVPATGKSASGALKALGDSLTSFLIDTQPCMPGIFLNGLLVKADGQVIFERTLGKLDVLKVLQEVKRLDLTPLLYSADNVLVYKRSSYTDMFMVSFEPEPQEADLDKRAVQVPIHKILLVDESGGDIRRFRAGLSRSLNKVATITQARPDVLEVLPKGASKGRALQHLLSYLQISKESAMAVGDGENDLEMLQAAGIAVATGNAVPTLIDVAHHVVCCNDHGAVADAINNVQAPHEREYCIDASFFVTEVEENEMYNLRTRDAGVNSCARKCRGARVVHGIVLGEIMGGKRLHLLSELKWLTTRAG